MLRELPDAALSAVSPGGFFVPMPPEVPLHGQQVISGHTTALEFVAAEDLMRVTSAWLDAHQSGAASVQARAIEAPENLLTIHYVDATDDFGVYLCFILGDGDFLTTRRHDAGAMRPRVSIVRKTNHAVFLSVDSAAETLLGRTDLVGRRNLDLIHPDDAPRAIANWVDMLAAPGQSRRVRLRQQHGDGTWIWFEVTNRNRLNDPDEQCVVTEMIDISEEMAAQEHLRTQERLLRELTSSLPVGVAQFDAHGLVVHHNRRFLDILELPALQHVRQILGPVTESDRSILQRALTAPKPGADRQVEVAVHRADDTVGHCQVIVRALEDGNGAIICLNDVTDSVRLRDELEHRATHDPLTGCLNRAAILAHLNGALHVQATERRAPEPGVAVAFIDLDGFKAVNDEHGHGAGDALLVAVSRCLQGALRDSDVVGRFGGDEFLAVAAGVANAEDAELLGRRIRDALSTRFAPTHGHAVASIGIAWTPSDRTTTPAELINLADAAMYRSKAIGHGEPVVDQPPLDDAA
jgi:diguanylate cyclase (GGDEF)-like protein/PAS domain S-box-containing protein